MEHLNQGIEKHSAPQRSTVRKFFRITLRSLAFVLRFLAGLLHMAATSIGLVRVSRVDYVPRKDDVFIVTYPRSGTTWMQMMLYQLTTSGDMDFTHISQHVPWFERYGFLPKDIEDLPSPRLFKTHLPYKTLPKATCKYIYVARNGRDVIESYFHLYRTHTGFQGDFNQFFRMFMSGRVQFGSWFRHVAGWYAQRDNPNVLFLRYEEMLKDLPGTIRRVAEFCEIPLTDERFERVLERSSFAFMKEHQNQFDPLFEMLLEQGWKGGPFIRKGQSGEGKKVLTQEQEARYLQAFNQTLSGTGLE